jgi:Zn-finger nucleic acid-binding protein
MGTSAVYEAPAKRGGKSRRMCLECDAPLKQRLRDGVEIDFCPHCLSVWLDRGEFERILDRMRGPEVDPILYWGSYDVSTEAMMKAEYVA